MANQFKVQKIKLDSKGIQEVLKSQGVQSLIESEAKARAQRAGGGYMAALHMGKRRTYANVYPSNAEAAKDNLENNTLLKVLK